MVPVNWDYQISQLPSVDGDIATHHIGVVVEAEVRFCHCVSEHLMFLVKLQYIGLRNFFIPFWGHTQRTEEEYTTR